MKRTTIMLPNQLKIMVQRIANSMGVSLGEFIRESLEARLKSSKSQNNLDTLFSDETIYRGKSPENLSKEHDHYLYGEKH